MTRKSVIIIAIVVAVVLGVVAAFAIPRWYASQESEKAAAAPSLSEAATAELAAPQVGTYQVGEGSFAGYRVAEVLNGADVIVTGRTEQVSGSAAISDNEVSAAEIVVDVASITTDSDRRDNYFRSQALETETYPQATFVLSEPAVLPEGASSVTLVGELTIRDISAPVTVDAQVAGTNGGTNPGMQVVGSIPVVWSDYGVSAPSLGFVSVENEGAIEFSLNLEQR